MEQLNKYYRVLNRGYVGVVDYMGDESSIVDAARCSYQGGTKRVSDDVGLIRTLIRDEHTSPIEMCELKLHIKLPIMCMRQIVRHRTASLNEISGRYSILNTEYYTPKREQCCKQSIENKQGSIVGDYLEEEEYEIYEGTVENIREGITDHYQALIESGLTRELARLDLPLSIYTEMYWKMDLRNLLHFLKLRLDKHAQWETRQYARVIASIVRDWVPNVWAAFEDYVLNARHFSNQEWRIIEENTLLCMSYRVRDEVSKAAIVNLCQKAKMSNRETNTFLNKLVGRSPYDPPMLDTELIRL